MNITLMEKTYKDNKVVLYVNGFVGVISDKTMLDSTMKTLQLIGYNIKDINFLLHDNDEVPNNEVNYWHEGDMKSPVYLKESSWIHQCDKGCCMQSGYKLKVNGSELIISQSLLDELSDLLSKLGHPVYAKKDYKITLCKPGVSEGACIAVKNEYDEFEEINELMLSIDNILLESEDLSKETHSTSLKNSNLMLI